MEVQVLLGLLAWALISGPLLLLWWLPSGSDRLTGRRAPARWRTEKS